MGLVKFQPPRSSDEREDYIAAMWLMFLRAPGRETAPGEVIDLGEIGHAPEQTTFQRWCPYSPAERRDRDVSEIDTDDVRIRWMLHRYHNRCHDGEIWFVFSTPNGVVLTEQSGKWPDGVLLGEVQTRIVNGKFEDRIVPIMERSEQELQLRREQTERHKAYRAELYKRYPLTERVKDLGGINELQANQD